MDRYDNACIKGLHKNEKKIKERSYLSVSTNKINKKHNQLYLFEITVYPVFN